MSEPKGEATMVRFPPDSDIWLLPLFYTIPMELLKLQPKFLDLPRCPHEMFTNMENIQRIQTDEFRVFVYDVFAWVTWKRIVVPKKNEEYRSIPGGWQFYSGHFPIWQLCYLIRGLIIDKYHEDGYSLQALFNMKPGQEVRWIPYDDFIIMNNFFVDQVIREEGFQDIIDTVWTHRDFNDYDDRPSDQKADFRRSWYHNSKKYTHVSLDNPCVEDGNVSDLYNEVSDYRSEFEESVFFKIKLEHFISTLPKKDMEILQLRLNDKTQQQIADEMGYKTASAVKKRIDRIAKKYDSFVAEHYSEIIDD